LATEPVPEPSQPRHPPPPDVRLGTLAEGGLAPAILAIVERGVNRRPALARELRADVQLDYDEGYPPVRVVFAGHHVLIEDGPSTAPDLRVSGALPDLVSLMMTPHLGGLPNPIAARGRAALGMVVFRRVRIQGRLGLLRRLLRVIAV
jgi:acetyl esterase/lipase